MKKSLADEQCIPCAGGIPRLNPTEILTLMVQLSEGWSAVEDHHLEKEFTFKNFREALGFTNRVGEIAEQEGHHPEITLTWGRATVRIWTHKAGGLTKADFVLAAKADRAFQKDVEEEGG